LKDITSKKAQKGDYGEETTIAGVLFSIIGLFFAWVNLNCFLRYLVREKEKQAGGNGKHSENASPLNKTCGNANFLFFHLGFFEHNFHSRNLVTAQANIVCLR
jgi:hypothetical protein